MGEYAYHPKGDDIKIGVMDQSFYTRHELLHLKNRGYGAMPPDKYNNKPYDELQTMLDADTFYPLPFEDLLKRLESDDGYSLKLQIELSGPLNLASLMEHNSIYLYGGSYEKRRYVNNCPFGSDGRDLKQNYFTFILVGERWKKEQPRSIFACSACGTWFSMPENIIKLVKESNPVFEEYHWIKLYPNTKLKEVNTDDRQKLSAV